ARVDDAASLRLLPMSLLVVAWLVAGGVLRARRPSEPLGLLLLALATGASIGMASTVESGPFADLVTRMVAALLPFAGLHVLVTLPDGSFTARSHRTVVLVGYATGALVGLGLWAARPSLPWWPIALEVVLAGAVGFPMANGRYRRAAVRERQRMQWFGCAVAAGVAAALCLPARERLERFANRLVYGERHAPDEVLRTFGSRLSRAVPLDELLLQMVESLRKTLALQAAEVWTGSNGLLERTV